MSTELQALHDRVRMLADWPHQGAVFCDLTPLMADPRSFHTVVSAVADHFATGIADAGGPPITAVLGIESRGFAIAAAVAFRLDAGFVPVRRAGRLPASVVAEEYAVEFGSDLLEVQRDAVGQHNRVLVVDDILGSGATAAAVVRLVHRIGSEVAGVACIAEMASHGGREALGDTEVFSVLTLDDSTVEWKTPRQRGVDPDASETGSFPPPEV